jgi:hypothetical protein
MSLLIKLMAAEQTMEIGVYTGYSSLCVPIGDGLMLVRKRSCLALPIYRLLKYSTTHNKIQNTPYSLFTWL